jgi:hypothetical protein
MDSYQLTRFYSQQLKRFNQHQTHNAAYIVAQYIEACLALARYYQKSRCSLLQELYLRRCFYGLLNKICDPLQSDCKRKQCLDQLYKPLLSLKRFYKKYDISNKKYLQLEHELRVLSHEFTPY